jgi:hypothetical protein
MVAAVTLNVQLNRISENPRASYLSLMANADLLSYTAYNQATHDILSTRTIKAEDDVKAFLQNDPTLEQIIYWVSPGLTATRTHLRKFGRVFIQLTFGFDR